MEAAMETTNLRSLPSLASDMTGVSRSRRHFTPLMHPPGYPMSPPTCSPTLPTLEHDDATTFTDIPQTPQGRPSTPFPIMKGSPQEEQPCSLVRSSSRSWPLGPRCGVYFGQDVVPIVESKYRSKIPVAKTYLSKSRHSSASPEVEHVRPARPVAVNVLAADSRIASALSGVEQKAAELERLQNQIKEVNTRLQSLNVSGGGSGRAKYRSIISRGRPLPSFMDEERTSEPEPKVEYRRDSATVVPPPIHATRHRYSKTKSTQGTLSGSYSMEWSTGSDNSSERQRRHRTTPSDTQASSTTNGQETDETFSDSDRVSLKNFPSTPRSRRSRIPRRPISSMMSTSSSFSDMPTVYETRMATPVTYQEVRGAGYGVSTVYNHRPAHIKKKTATHIEPIGELDEAAEVNTLASEHIDQDLGTLGGYLVTPDLTPSSTDSTKPKYTRQCTPMRPAALRVVNGTPSIAASSATKAAPGPLPPKFALSPAVRPQHLSQSMLDRQHPAFRNDPFCAMPQAEDVEEEEEEEDLFEAHESPRYSNISQSPPDRVFDSSPGWPLAEEPEEEFPPHAQSSTSRYPGVFRKLFHQQSSSPLTQEPESSNPKSAGSAKRPLRTWLRKITPRRKHDSAQPTPESATANTTTALTLKRTPTTRVSAPPSLLPYRNRDSTLRFEQMLMKEIGGHAGCSDAGGSTSGRLARRASIASLQLLSRTMTETTSSAASTVCPPPAPVAGGSPVRNMQPLRDFHIRNPTISTFRCSMAFV